MSETIISALSALFVSVAMWAIYFAVAESKRNKK